MKRALDDWPPAVLMFLRVLICLPILWATVGRGAFSRATRDDWIRMAIVGVFGLAAPHLVGIYGLRETDSMNGAVLIGMEPITIVLLSWLVLGERLSVRQLIGIFLAIVGGVWVVSRGEWSALGGGAASGNLLLALHGALWAIYTVASKPVLDRVSPTGLTTITATVAVFALAPAALLELDQVAVEHIVAPLPIFWVLALGLGVSYGVTLLWNAALARLRAVEMASLVFIQPIAGAILGVLTGETLYAATIFGATLVFAGVWLSQTPSPKNEAA